MPLGVVGTTAPRVVAGKPPRSVPATAQAPGATARTTLPGVEHLIRVSDEVGAATKAMEEDDRIAGAVGHELLNAGPS